MSDLQRKQLIDSILNLLQERRALREKKEYLISECWQDLKRDVDALQKEVKETSSRIETNDIQLAETIDLFNEEVALDDDSMYG